MVDIGTGVFTLLERGKEQSADNISYRPSYTILIKIHTPLDVHMPSSVRSRRLSAPHGRAFFGPASVPSLRAEIGPDQLHRRNGGKKIVTDVIQDSWTVRQLECCAARMIAHEDAMHHLRLRGHLAHRTDYV